MTDTTDPKSARIFVLPGVDRRDLCGAPVESEQVFRGAIENGVTDAVVVGLSRDGRLYIAAATADIDRAVGILMRGVSHLSTFGRFVR